MNRTKGDKDYEGMKEKRVRQRERNGVRKEIMDSVTRKKLPNVFKSCPKMISLEELKTFTPLQKLPKMWTIWAK